MKKFAISSLPFKDIITDLAKEMDTGFTEDCTIYKVKIPERFGSGKITGVDFDDGLGLIQYCCTFHKDTHIEFSVDKIHPVKFLFCQESEIRHKFMNESTWHDIPQYKNAIVASTEHHGHIIQFKAGRRTLFTSLELDRRKFQPKISCELKSLDKQWHVLLNDITAKKTFYHDGYFSLQFSEILRDWDKFDQNSFVRKLHLEGLAYKILVLQIMQFEDDIKSEGSKTMLRKSELNQMKKALNMIDENLEDLPTVEQIAFHVGLNPRKLQQGFREVFGNSVNEYIRNKRLEIIRTLLGNSEHSLTTIASIVGIKSQSYLSKVFKETYGVQPSEFRKNLKLRKVNLEFKKKWTGSKI